MIRWGILGCGSVTEVKSGPALQKARRSSVIACMRREASKAQDYANRHNIPKAYTDADALLNDPDVNAIYIATPPDSHAELTIRAMHAGKPVLVEKPMALSTTECDAMIEASLFTGQPLITAYYRRALPRFEKFRQIITDGTIGEPRSVLIKHLDRNDNLPACSWKTDPQIGGGGLFVDMQSHTLDWLDYVFGPARQVTGIVRNQSEVYPAEDFVSYTIGYDTVVATSVCVYSAGQKEENVTVFGSKGSARMSFFSPSPIVVSQGGMRTVYDVKDPNHVHQPFIEQTIAHLLEGGPNPLPPEAARRTNAVIEDLYQPMTLTL